MFRATSNPYAGNGITADMSIRDIYLAETLCWHIEHAEPGARVVVAAHNNHIQKSANVVGDATTALPMGQHLAAALGEDYVAIGVTHTDGHVPEMRPDAAAPVGFTLQDVNLPGLPPGSIEAALLDAGLRDRAILTDLRPAPGTLTSIRTQSALMHTPLGEAFDAVLSVPTVTRDPSVRS
jgi:erythromycin esterase